MAEKLRSLAAEHAATADAERRLPVEVIGALREAGFARHFVPSRWGGIDGTFTELTRAVLTVSEGCANTGWCASLAAHSARLAAHLPLEGQHELWSGGVDVFVVTGLVPSGRALPVDAGGSQLRNSQLRDWRVRGWRLCGRWRYVSGVDFADWALLCATCAPEPSEPRFFALPRGAFRVVETWDSIGMRATGSHTVVVDDVFVPAHRSFARAELLTGAPSPAVAGVPLAAIAGLTFVAPAVGAASGALRTCAATFTGRRRTPGNEIKLVRASGAVDAARHLVEQNAAVADERTFTPALLARNERNAAFAADLVYSAVGDLASVAGTGGLAEANPLQRFWRDVTSATSHIALQYETAAAPNYSTILAGRD